MPSWLESLLLTLTFLAGVAAVAVGAGLVYLPAGLIVGGLLAVLCAAGYARAAARAPS